MGTNYLANPTQMLMRQDLFSNEKVLPFIRYNMKGGFFMTLELFVALLFVIIFSIILEIIVRCPILVSSIVAIISLIVFAIFFETLTLTFIIWIILYTATAFVVAFFTERILRKRRDNSCF